MEQEVITQLFSQISELRELIENRRSEWLTLVVPILAGLFGFLAAWFPNVHLEKQRRLHERVALYSAIVAEMSALTEIIRGRKYIEHMRYAAENDPYISFSVNIPSDYALVYKGNVTRLGLLETQDAMKIVHCYKLIESVVQDVIPGGTLSNGLAGRDAFQQDAEYLEKAVSLTEEVRKSYFDKYPSSA